MFGGGGGGGGGQKRPNSSTMTWRPPLGRGSCQIVRGGVMDRSRFHFVKPSATATAAVDNNSIAALASSSSSSNDIPHSSSSLIIVPSPQKLQKLEFQQQQQQAAAVAKGSNRYKLINKINKNIANSPLAYPVRFSTVNTDHAAKAADMALQVASTVSSSNYWPNNVRSFKGVSATPSRSNRDVVARIVSRYRLRRDVPKTATITTTTAAAAAASSSSMTLRPVATKLSTLASSKPHTAKPKNRYPRPCPTFIELGVCFLNDQQSSTTPGGSVCPFDHFNYGPRLNAIYMTNYASNVHYAMGGDKSRRRRRRQNSATNVPFSSPSAAAASSSSVNKRPGISILRQQRRNSATTQNDTVDNAPDPANGLGGHGIRSTLRASSNRQRGSRKISPLRNRQPSFMALLHGATDSVATNATNVDDQIPEPQNKVIK